jgi:hypothetical protein
MSRDVNDLYDLTTFLGELPAADRILFNPTESVLAITTEDEAILRFDGFTSYDAQVDIEQDEFEGDELIPDLVHVDSDITKVTITLRLESVKAWSLSAPEENEREAVTL